MTNAQQTYRTAVDQPNATGDEAQPGDTIRFGKNGTAILESYSPDGRWMTIRRILKGRPCKSTSTYAMPGTRPVRL